MFVISDGGILGREALVVLANLNQLMAEKNDEPILHVWGCINSRITIEVTISYSLMIHVAWLPIPLQDWEPDWGLASGLGLEQ